MTLLRIILDEVTRRVYLEKLYDVIKNGPDERSPVKPFRTHLGSGCDVIVSRGQGTVALR